MCSVPGCVVSRATLAKWRQAAVETFLFPPALPLTLHSCPDWERDRWMAEIDLDPASRARSGKQTVMIVFINLRMFITLGGFLLAPLPRRRPEPRVPLPHGAAGRDKPPGGGASVPRQQAAARRQL